MARKKQTRGACVFCGREMTRGGLVRHLQSCDKRMASIATADGQRGRNQTIYHLQIQDAWSGDFWLHAEMRGNATLVDLDAYLRAIWVECCGHLSAFHIGPWRYTQIFNDGLSMGDEKSMNVQVRTLFEPGQEIPYEYDFGSTTELTIKVVDERTGKPLTKHPIFLMARNGMPAIPCVTCGEQATWLCLDCLYTDNNPECEYCDTHINAHDNDHDSEEYGGPMPLVNSPRAGVCGYEGPAEPPY